MADFNRAYAVEGNEILDARVPKKGGNVGENLVTSLSFTFSDEWLGASKTIVFKSPKKVLLTPVALVDDSVPVPVEALDSAGKLQFSLQGTFADSAKVIRTPIKELDVNGTLPYTGGTPIATYTNVVSECQDATVLAETATLAANHAAADAMEVANMTVVAETLAAGTPATATLTDDSDAKLLTLGIPQGIQGEQGEQGIQGAQGIQGIQGVKGDTGEVTTAQLNAALALKADYSRNLRYWARPAAYKIKVAAGRFNMSWNNPSGRMWVFPKGTVNYGSSTPISSSTVENPDVTIPAGGGYVWLVCVNWSGLYTLNDNGSNTTVTGSLADLPPLTNILSLTNCSLVTGAYANVNGTNVPTTTVLSGTGLSSADMDNTLIAYAACTKTGGIFTATGKTRTSASNAAVATLGSRGWAISGLMVV